MTAAGRLLHGLLRSIASGLILLASSAHAGETPQGTEAPSGEQRGSISRAEAGRLFDRTDYQGALVLFRYPDPTDLFWVGECQLRLGQHKDALRSFSAYFDQMRQYLRLVPAAKNRPEIGEYTAQAGGRIFDIAQFFRKVRRSDRREDALEAYQTYLQVAPQGADRPDAEQGMLQVGRSYDHEGQNRLALRTFERVLSLSQTPLVRDEAQQGKAQSQKKWRQFLAKTLGSVAAGVAVSAVAAGVTVSMVYKPDPATHIPVNIPGGVYP